MNIVLLFLFLNLIGLVLYLLIFSDKGYANDSPTLARKQYNDMVDDDWIVSGNNVSFFFNNSSYKSIVKNVNDGGAFIDIGAITYSISENFLNATLHFKSDVTKAPNLGSLSYGMWLDVDNDKESGVFGWDYLVKVTVRNSTLTSNLLELFPNGEGYSRHKYSDNNYPGLTRSSVDIYLDWNEINKPQRFSMMFFVSEDVSIGNKQYTITDGSDWIIVPPSDLELKAEPHIIDIEAGESRVIEWSVNSSSMGYGATSMFLNDRPVSVISPYYPERMLPSSLRGLSYPTCYESTVNPDFITESKRKLNFVKTEANYTVSEANAILESFNLTRNDTGNNLPELKIINGGQVDGIKISRNAVSPIFDDFNKFNTHYHQITIKTFENASRGVNYLTISTNVIDTKIGKSFNYFYPGLTVFGNETFFSCAPKYRQADLGAGEIDVRINILPPKDSIKKLNDFLRNYDTLVPLVGGMISGGLLFALASAIRKVIRNRRNRK